MRTPSILSAGVFFGMGWVLSNGWVSTAAAVPANPPTPNAAPAAESAPPANSPAPAQPVAEANAPTPPDASMVAFGDSIDDLARLRDPFRRKAIDRAKLIPRTELEGIDYNEVKVLGIVASGAKRVAMISAGQGRTYFVRVGQKIGANGGKVTKITDDFVEITEHAFDEIGDKTENVTLLKVPPEGRGNLSWTPKPPGAEKTEMIERYSRDLGAPPAGGMPGGSNP